MEKRPKKYGCRVKEFDVGLQNPVSFAFESHPAVRPYEISVKMIDDYRVVVKQVDHFDIWGQPQI